jgi:hypothetical protein
MNTPLSSLRPRSREFLMILILPFLCLGWTALPLTAQQVSQPKDQTQDGKEGFGGSFKSLNPEQQKLVVNLVQAHARATKTQLDPEKVYDAARQSIRSTFDAVTHALWKTKMTGPDGKSLGTALDLIDAVEDIAGEVPEARGDRQFRIYVYLKSNTIQTLDASQEFKREKDNTHYHFGFPICFRLLGGPPSIQCSISRDGKRGDFDVDYRSSSFPSALVNGHLSAANSDVRAGDNLDRHDGRWSGLAGWWQGLFGLPLQSSSTPEETTSQTVIPLNPRVSEKEGLDTAVHDFLTSWIIEQKPNLAVAYLSPRSFPCVEEMASERGKPLERGIVKPQLMIRMAAFNNKVGKPAKVEDVLENVKSWNPRFKPVKNRYESQFLLFSVPNDFAAAADCAERNAVEPAPAKKEPSKKYGDYFGSAFRLKAGDSKGSTVYFLWSKEGNYWKIVALKTADEADPKMVATTASAATPKVPPMPRVNGDPKLIQAVQQFLSAWFLKQEYETALSFLSPKSYVCLDFSGDAAKKGLGPEQARRAVLDGFEKGAQAIGKKAKLEDAIQAVPAQHELLKAVTHKYENAYSLTSLPDGMAEDRMCSSADRGKGKGTELDDPRNKTYGHYYVSSFELKVSGREPAALHCLWGLEDGSWKILAWKVISD